ncbi:hypothetical protein EP073_12005 [Geovibrio thiophilus]|uniref:Uncharacterized protein n=1 Tax=Geovibrio thiophilus TaxID=139438 RepID=A0A3R5V0C1_9BACT|nr:hypothetical protein [Geovibrio thiophilus]QAR34100.1 hypothetical protein EP073_12005 [Geovibrio thiophilus]
MAEVTVSFVTPARGGEKTVIELDDEMNLDSSGSAKKFFRYGETAYFRVYSPLPASVRAVSSDGVVTEHGLGTAAPDVEFIPFTESNEAGTKYPVRDIVSAVWLGKSLGNVKKSGAYSVSCEIVPDAAGESGVGLLELSYSSGFKRFGITLPKKSRAEYPVLIYVFQE